MLFVSFYHSEAWGRLTKAAHAPSVIRYANDTSLPEGG